MDLFIKLLKQVKEPTIVCNYYCLYSATYCHVKSYASVSPLRLGVVNI